MLPARLLLVHPDCKVTRKGLQGGYKFKRVQVSGEERYRDAPDKNMYSHPCEAGQYLVMGGGDHKGLMRVPPQFRRSPAVAQTIHEYNVFGGI